MHAKKTELIFVIHDIPLTCLNCLLILLVLGEQVVNARTRALTTSNNAHTSSQHSAYSYVVRSISCELCVYDATDLFAEIVKKEEEEAKTVLSIT